MPKSKPSNAQGNGKRKASKDSPIVRCGTCKAPVSSNVEVVKCVHCNPKHEKYPKEK